MYGLKYCFFCLVLMFLSMTFVACSSNDDNTIDGDTEVDGDSDSMDGDVEEDGDYIEGDEIEGCDFEAPYCEGEDVISCNNGTLDRQTCTQGTFCNYGECKTSAVSLPQDAGFHDEPTEWWYYTGHLTDGTGEWGFEVTIFQYDLSYSFGMDGMGYMCHVGVTDKTASEHYHFDTLHLSYNKWKNSPVELDLWNCHFYIGGDGKDHIIGEIPAGKEKDKKASPWKIDLTVEPQKRVALHGGDGIIPMSNAGGTSWYYSFTRLKADGSLTTPDGEYSVSGQAWMDHQWGQFDISEFKGWDWWSMQFEDGYEIMLFTFTNWDGELDSQAGTIVDPDGNTTEFEGLDSFEITPIRSWESPHTDGVYPLDWDISIPTMNWQLRVTTSVDDQEMYNPAQNYWEGETSISGTRNGVDVSGVGYTELTGYASDYLDPKFEEE